MLKTESSVGRGTALGLLALLIWGSSVAVSKATMLSFGRYTAPAINMTIAGLAGILLLALKPGGLRNAVRLPKKYLLVCGGLFVGYETLYLLAVAFADGPRQLLHASILNYLWPSLTLVFSIPILKTKAKWTLAPALAVAFGGAALALIARDSGEPLCWSQTWQDILSNPAPYVFSTVGASMWALYSNFSRRFASESTGNATPFFLLACGLIFTAARFIDGETIHWPDDGYSRFKMIALTAYAALLVNAAAYAFWDRSMRTGNAVIVMVASQGTPVLSAACIALMFGTLPDWRFWTATVLVVLGSVAAKASVKAKPKSERENEADA